MNEKQVYVRVPTDLHKSIGYLALEKGTSRNELMLEALNEYVKKHQKPQ